MDLYYYCTNCKENLCIYCIKQNEKNNKHNNHCFKKLLDEMPSLERINNLKDKIIKKSNCYKQLIYKLNDWKRKINIKIEELIHNLNDEITLLEKMFLTFEKFFFNYIYFSNFYYFDEFIKDINNEYLVKFNDSADFELQSQNIINYFLLSYPKKIKTKNINGELELYYKDSKESKIEKLNNKYFLEISSSNLILKFYDKTIKSKNKLQNFKEKIFSISISLDEKNLYACLLNKKIVIILDITDNDIKISNQKIECDDNKDSHFYKCIQIRNKNLVTSDDNSIIIWEKIKEEFNNIQKININKKIPDILLVNDEFSICSQPSNNTIIVINTIKLTKEKIIPNIDCVDSQHSLFNCKEYIIINCYKGIAFLYIKTKEIVQYIQNFNNDYDFKYKEISLDSEDRIYILKKEKKYNNNYSYSSSYLNINLYILEWHNESLEITKEYEKNKIDEGDLNIFCLNKGDIFLNGNYLYLLNEK